VKEVYKAYPDWCQQNGECQMDSRNLSKELKQRGFQSKRSTDGYHYWLGLRLNSVFKMPIAGGEVKLSEAPTVYNA
jgi:putative DNA primase/helicase